MGDEQRSIPIDPSSAHSTWIPAGLLLAPTLFWSASAQRDAQQQIRAATAAAPGIEVSERTIAGKKYRNTSQTSKFDDMVNHKPCSQT